MIKKETKAVRQRDQEQAVKLSVARQLIDDIWKGAEGTVLPEEEVRATVRRLLDWEKVLRDSA